MFQSREHKITAVDKIELSPEAWVWHSATSFTVPFLIAYKQVTSYTKVETRQASFALRFYRSDINSPVNDLLATEGQRERLDAQGYTHDQVKAMKTLRQGL